MTDDILPDGTRPESEEYALWSERHEDDDQPPEGDPWDVDDAPEPDLCPHCGKDYDDWSDLGCGQCDARSPDYGLPD